MTSPTLLGDGWESVNSSTMVGDVGAGGPETEAVRQNDHVVAGPSVISENHGLLSVSAALVGALSYVCTLLMANNLSSPQYSDFAAAQMLLGIAGTIAAALVPLPLSHAVATYPAGATGRQEGLAFAVLVSVVIGSVAALVTGFLTAAFAPLSMAIAVALSSMMFFLVAAPHGWLQGELRFKWYALSTLGEIVIRLSFTLLVVTVAWGATGGVLGFTLGSLALLIVPLAFYRDLRFDPETLKQRWRWSETGDIALVLCVVSALIGLDVVIIAFLDGGSDAAAGFQALATIAKGPVYIAAGTALVAFPLLRTPNVNVSEIVARALRSFGLLALPTAAVIATIPHDLMGLVLPLRYHPSLELLPWLAVAGLGYAAMSVLATILLALRRYRRCQVGLVTTTFVIPAGILMGWQVNGVTGLALGSAVGSLFAAAAMAAIAGSMLPPSTARWTINGIVIVAILTVLLAVAAAVLPSLWPLLALVAGIVVLVLQRSDTSDMRRIMNRLARRRHTRPHVPRLSTKGSLIGFAFITTAAFGVRAVGLTRSFELQGDELLYAELGRSVSDGQWPNLELKDLHDGPFFLHPPGFFLITGLAIKIFGLEGGSFDLVYDLRWLNALIGAVTVGLGFLLMRKLANVPVAWITAIVLAFEPFMLRNHSRVYIETFGMAVILGGLLVIISTMMRQPSRPFRPMFLGGMLLGYGVLTKDIFVLVAAAPIVMAVIWRRTLPLNQAATILFGATIPYAIYLALINRLDMFPGWMWAKTYGVRRMLGFEQETGFNAEGAPSLTSRLIDEAGSFGTSYVLLGLGPLAALLVCLSPSAERRLLGLAGLTMGIFGLFCAAFGALEEQYGYPVMVAGTLSIAVATMELFARWPSLTKPATAAGVVFALLTVILGVRAETATDNGFARFREWMSNNLPSDTKVSVTNITAELAFAQDDPRFGAWPSPELMEQNDAQYVLTQSKPTMHGYGYTQPEMLEWLSYRGTEVVSFIGPTNGATTLWLVDEREVAKAADAGIGLPMWNYYAER